MKYKAGIFCGVALASGIAIACSSDVLPLPIPPVPVKISWTDTLRAQAQGYSNPLNAAARMKLDSLASTAVGKSVWKSNNFAGHFVVASPAAGVVKIYIDKPCDEEAVDNADKSATSNNGGGGPEGGGGGAGGGGGGGGPIGGGCYGNCSDSPYYGNVGEVEKV